MWKILALIMLIFNITGVASAQDQGDIKVEFEGIYWFTDLDAKAQVKGQTQRGTEFNLERDFGLRDRDIPGGRFTWYTGPKSRLFLEYSQKNLHGQKIIDRQIVFRDTTYDVGANVEADYETKLAKFGWVWQFITSSHQAFKLGTLFEARGVFTDISLAGQTVGGNTAKAEKSFNFGVPTIGIALDINPSDWSNLFLQTSGMYFGRYGYFGSGEAGIKLIPIKNLSISGGYRYERMEGRSDGTDSFLRFTFKGPFAAASLRF